MKKNNRMAYLWKYLLSIPLKIQICSFVKCCATLFYLFRSLAKKKKWYRAFTSFFVSLIYSSYAENKIYFLSNPKINRCLLPSAFSNMIHLNTPFHNYTPSVSLLPSITYIHNLLQHNRSNHQCEVRSIMYQDSRINFKYFWTLSNIWSANRYIKFPNESWYTFFHLVYKKYLWNSENLFSWKKIKKSLTKNKKNCSNCLFNILFIK